MKISQRLIKEVEERLEQERRAKKPYSTKVEGKDFIVLPGVHSPKFFFGSHFCAKHVPKYVTRGGNFLEIGSGTGVVSCHVGIYSDPRKIVATDIEPEAVKNTNINALLHNLEHKITARQGDLFQALCTNNRFDEIFWNMPFVYHNFGEGTFSRDVSDPRYGNIGAFICIAQGYLKPKGRLLLGFSRQWGNYQLLTALCKGYHYQEPKTLVSETYDIGNRKVPEATFELLEVKVKGESK